MTIIMIIYFGRIFFYITFAVCSDETIVTDDRLSIVERTTILIIDYKIYNRKSSTSLNTNKFQFTCIYNMCFPSWNLIYTDWYSIIYSNLLSGSLLKIVKQHIYFIKFCYFFFYLQISWIHISGINNKH